MTAALLLCEIGLLAWLCWHLEPYRRPAFCLLIFVMASAASAYHIPRPASEFEASQTIQMVALGLALLEGIWQAGVEGFGQRLGLLGFCGGFAALTVVAAEGLDSRFGTFITGYTLTLVAMFGMALGAAIVTWKRHVIWFATFCAIKPAGALSYWFFRDPSTSGDDTWAQWWSINDAVMLGMAALMIAWPLWVTDGRQKPLEPVAIESR